MKTTLIATACSLLVLPLSAVYAAPADLVGDFEGVIWSAGLLAPSKTTFLQTDQHQRYGYYHMQTHEGIVTGQLYECSNIRPQFWRCIWSDPFGVGTLELQLSPDGDRFEGEWRSSSEPRSQVGMDWTGKRIKSKP